MTIKSSYTAIAASVAATTIYLVLGSATVRYHVEIYYSPNVILIFFLIDLQVLREPPRVSLPPDVHNPGSFPPQSNK